MLQIGNRNKPALHPKHTKASLLDIAQHDTAWHSTAQHVLAQHTASGNRCSADALAGAVCMCLQIWMLMLLEFLEDVSDGGDAVPALHNCTLMHASCQL